MSADAQTPSETLTLCLYRDWLHEKAATSYFAAYRGDLIAIAYGIERLEREIAAAKALAVAVDVREHLSAAHAQIDQLRATVARQAEEIERLRKLAERKSVALTGLQLKHALDFTANDDEAQISIGWFDECPPGPDGEPFPAGYYAWFTEYPEEGRLLLPEAIDTALAKEPRK